MAHPDLLEHNRTQFAKSVVELGPGIWTAVGYAASTQHMVEGQGSVTIIDTSEMSSIAETQILKTHNWNHLLLGVKISGSLGNGTEYSEVYKTTYFDKIQPEMQILLEPYRKAIKLVEDWLGYDNPDELTIGLQDIYHQMNSETQENSND